MFMKNLIWALTLTALPAWAQLSRDPNPSAVTTIQQVSVEDIRNFAEASLRQLAAGELKLLNPADSAPAKKALDQLLQSLDGVRDWSRVPEPKVQRIVDAHDQALSAMGADPNHRLQCETQSPTGSRLVKRVCFAAKTADDRREDDRERARKLTTARQLG